MKPTVRFLACLSLAALSTTAAHAQLSLNYPYGFFQATHSGRMLTGYDEFGYPILLDYGKADAAGGWGTPAVGSLSHGMWTYANPAGGGYVVTLDVPNAALHSYLLAPPEFHMLYQGNPFGTTSGGGYVWVGFQDAITISGPPLAAGQTIPITLRAHLDGTLLPGNGVYTPTDNYGYVRFNTQLRGKDGTVGFGYYQGQPNLNFERSVSTGSGALILGEDFLMTGDFGSDVSGAPLSFWLAADLFTQAGNSGSAQFVNTATFELILPEGYTYTSSLGFATAVPEPAHAALVAGLALLVIAGWRRRGLRSVNAMGLGMADIARAREREAPGLSVGDHPNPQHQT